MISIPGKLKIETITAPFSGSPEFLDFASTEISSMMRNLSITKSVTWKVYDKGLLWLETGSPTHRSS